MYVIKLSTNGFSRTQCLSKTSFQYEAKTYVAYWPRSLKTTMYAKKSVFFSQSCVIVSHERSPKKKIIYQFLHTVLPIHWGDIWL